jgi:hypothetical protein
MEKNKINKNIDFNSLNFKEKVEIFEEHYKERLQSKSNLLKKYPTKITENDNIYNNNKNIIKINLNINNIINNTKINNNIQNININNIIKNNTQNPNIININKNINPNSNIINNNNNNKIKEKNNFIDDFEIADFNQQDFPDLNIDPMWKSDVDLTEVKIDLWEIIPISTPSKKAKKEYMKSFMSTIVYNGVMFKDKLSESNDKTIIIYDSLINNYNINQIKNLFVYMSYRNGLFNTQFLSGNKNNYTSDCGWGCMLRCCQMMLSRAFIKLRLNDFNNININHVSVDLKKIKEEIIYFFFDKFIKIENIHINKQIFELYKNILRKKVNVIEIIPPYSIYILTLLGNCPNVFTSDINMVKTFIKINKILFNENIAMIYFNGTVNKKKVVDNFCEKILSNGNNKNEYITYNNEKYIFKKRGIIFISLRLGLQKIESCFIDMIPKLFNNLHNNIGFVSGKKKKAYYFIGLNNKKLIFADPHFNQNMEIDESNFPSYDINELFLISPKELSSELTVGVAITNKNDLEQFFDDLTWFKQINPEFIGFQD